MLVALLLILLLAIYSPVACHLVPCSDDNIDDWVSNLDVLVVAVAVVIVVFILSNDDDNDSKDSNINEPTKSSNKDLK